MNRELNRWYLVTFLAVLLAGGRAMAVPVDKPLTDVTHGGGTFVAAGFDGTVYSSVAGGPWEKRSTGLTNSLRTVSFGGGVFIAAGEGGALIRSTNGVDWTVHSLPVTMGPPDSAWGDGRFVVMGNGSDATWTVLTSTNGIDWVASRVEAAGFLRQDGIVEVARFGGVGYGNGRFLATGGSSGLNLTLTSTDAIRWKEQPNDGIGNRGPVAFSGGKFATVGEYYIDDDDDDGGWIYTAPRISGDGLFWSGTSTYNIYTIAAIDCGFATAAVVDPALTRVQFIRGTQFWPVFQTPALVDVPQSVLAMAADGDRLVVVGSAISEVPIPDKLEPLDIWPRSTTAYLGSSVQIYAVPACLENPVEIRWFHGETEIPNARGTTLYLEQIDAGDAGEYRAWMTRADGSIVRSPASVLIVQEPPKPPDPVPAAPVVQWPTSQQNYMVGTGSRYSIAANFSGYPPPTYQWFHDHVAIPGATNANLQLHQVSEADAGTYELVASNQLGVATSAPAAITVFNAATTIDSNPPPTYTIREGDPLQIPSGILSFGFPSPSLQIKHDGQPTNLRLGTSGSLNFKQVQLSDAGTYEVVGSNSSGAFVHTMAVVVVLPGDALSRWKITNPLPFNATIFDIAYGAGRFVAVATDGQVAVSADGTQWTPSDLRTTANLDAVAFGNGRFVAAGGPGIVSSEDGIHWAGATSNLGWNLRSVVFGNGRFIAAGDEVILTSTNGMDWEEVRLEPYAMRGFNHAAFGNGRFVVNAISLVWASTDGITWETHPLDVFPNSETLRFVGGKFATVGDDGYISISTDALSWSTPVEAPATRLLDVAYGNGRWVAVGTRGRIVSSTDGVKWHKEDSGTSDRLEAVVFANGLFVAGGENGTTVTSVDGSQWTPAVRGPTSDLDDLTIAGDKVVIVGKDGTVLVTTNGVDLRRANSHTSADLHGIGWAPGLHVAVGEPGVIVTSPDAETWTVRTVTSTSSLKGVAHGAGRWVAVGTGGEIIVSNDGASWTPIDSPTVNDLNSVTYGNGLFVIVGDNIRPNGTLLTSTDGLNWTRRNQNFGKNLRSVTFLGDRFVATGNDGYRLESKDGIRWISRYPWEYGIWPVNLRSITEGADHLVVIGNYGSLFTTTTGTNWVRRYVPSVENLHGVVHFGGHFLTIGNRGTILRSDFIARTPELDLVTSDDGKSMGVRLHGEPGIPYRVEATDDLVSPNWIPIETGVEPDGSISVREATTGVRRFYRAVIPLEP